MKTQTLRQKAEARIASSIRPRKCGAPKDLKRLLAHELEVHRIELELQNDELERARADMEAVSSRFAELDERAPVAFVTLDAEGRITAANEAATALLGIEHAVLLRRPLSAFMRSADVDGFHRVRREVIAARKTSTCELALRCSGGGLHRVHLVVSAPSTIDRGEGGECRCALLDLSELRAADEARRVAERGARAAALADLRETKERFEAITEHVEDVFYITNADGRVSYVSAAYERIWGRPAGDLFRRPRAWLETVVEEDRRGVEDALAFLDRGDPFDVEYRIARPDGATRWIHDRAYPIEDEGGRVVRFVGIARDRTHERELELELTHAQRMETLGALSSGIAHDFNNILQVIVGAAALAADGSRPPDQVRKFLQHARDVAMRGAELVRHINGFARRDHVHRQPLSLDDALRDAAPFLRPLLGEHIDVVVDLAAPSAAVRASRCELEQILLNLASNGRDAMPEGGTLAIRTEVLSESVGVDGTEHVRLVVSDTGCGMDETTKARIFDRFFTTKAPGKGTGLGLATVHALVEQLGGALTVESEPGHGATFALVLPTCAPRRDPSPEVDTNVRLRGTALLVEDEPLVRTSLCHQLEQLGLDVLEADGPDRALDIARSLARAPDVIVSDVLMPGMTGPRMVTTLRDRWPDVGVLFVSGDPGDALERSSLDSRTRLLPKPFDRPELVAGLCELLGRSSVICAEPSPSSVPPRPRRGHRGSDAEGLEVVVRRLQGDGLVSPFTLRAQTHGALGRSLRAILESAAQERGHGIWSDADPEVWIDDELVGRLGPDADVAHLVATALERLRERES